MAKLYKRPRSRYWWARGRRVDGEEWFASTKQVDRRAAAKVARALELANALPPDPATARLPLGEALVALKQHKDRMERADATMEKLRHKGGQLIRHFGGEYDLQRLTLADTEAYLDRRRGEGAQLHTIAMELGTLQQALNVACRHGRYGRKPKHLMPQALEGAYVPRDRWLPVSEYRALLAALTPHRREYVVAYVSLGIRFSELYKIEARDLDHEARRVHVRGTKTKFSDRWVPCSDDVWTVLSRRAEEHPSGPLFPRVWQKGRLNSDVKRACERAGIDRCSTNDFRRTFASWLCSRGVPELTVARLLGQNSSAMLRRVYAQLAPDTLRAAIDVLPSVLNGVPEERITSRDSADKTDSGK